MAARWRWLGTPWFLGSVAVLAINDHVLKARFGTWWTGKLSDLAGVAVVATVAAVLVGPRSGVAATALAFAALKTVPGVAELVAPVLGGVTRRDPTDLLGLLALVPLWPLLAEDTAGARAGAGAGVVRPSPARHAGRRDPAVRRAAAGVLPIVGALTALFATTATSCAPDPKVEQVVARGSVLYAGFAGDRWAASRDGGESWSTSETDPDGRDASGPTTSTSVPPSTAGEPGSLGPGTATSDEADLGPLQVCGDDGCYRLVEHRTIERADDESGPWVAEHRITDGQLDAIEDGCAGGRDGVLSSVAVADDGSAVASAGAGGVLVRDAAGAWSTQSVLGADNGEPPPPIAGSPWFWAVAAVGVATAVASWVLARGVGRYLGVVGAAGATFAALVVVPIIRLSERGPFGPAHLVLAVGLGAIVLMLARLSSPPPTYAAAAPRLPPPPPPPPSRPNPPAPR